MVNLHKPTCSLLGSAGCCVAKYLHGACVYSNTERLSCFADALGLIRAGSGVVTTTTGTQWPYSSSLLVFMHSSGFLHSYCRAATRAATASVCLSKRYAVLVRHGEFWRSQCAEGPRFLHRLKSLGWNSYPTLSNSAHRTLSRPARMRLRYNSKVAPAVVFRLVSLLFKYQRRPGGCFSISFAPARFSFTGYMCTALS